MGRGRIPIPQLERAPTVRSCPRQGRATTSRQAQEVPWLAYRSHPGDVAKRPQEGKKKKSPITFQRLKKFGYCYRRLTHRLHAGHSIIASIYVVCCRPSRRVPGINSVLELLYTFVHFDPFQEENKNSLSPIYQHQAIGLKFMHNVSLLGVLLSNSSFHRCSNWRSRAVDAGRMSKAMHHVSRPIHPCAKLSV
jgi:hypothetical protein